MPTDRCIINVATHGEYLSGQRRLRKSLRGVGYKDDLLLFTDCYPPGCPEDKESPQAFKIYAFEEAKKRGHKVILWCDASIQFVRHPDPVFEDIERDGAYFIRTWYWAGQCAPDLCLKNCGVTREEANKIPGITGCMWGLDLRTDLGCRVLTWMGHRARDKSFCGGGWGPHSLSGKNPKEKLPAGIKFYRHEIPPLSIIARRLNYPLRDSIGTSWCVRYQQWETWVNGSKPRGKAVAVLCGQTIPLLKDLPEKNR